MNIRTTVINGQLFDVITEEEYNEKWRMYYQNPQIASTTLVETVYNGKKYLLPLKMKLDSSPGLYQEGCIYTCQFPTKDAADQFLSDKFTLIDFTDSSSVKDFLAKNNQIREMETKSVLTQSDTIFTPTIDDNDDPAMKAFKSAIIYKHTDLNNYSHRIGENFLNDKRILRTNSITLKKLISWCQSLDIEAELTLRDAPGAIANPMNKEISVILTNNEKE